MLFRSIVSAVAKKFPLVDRGHTKRTRRRGFTFTVESLEPRLVMSAGSLSQLLALDTASVTADTTPADGTSTSAEQANSFTNTTTVNSSATNSVAPAPATISTPSFVTSEIGAPDSPNSTDATVTPPVPTIHSEPLCDDPTAENSDCGGTANSGTSNPMTPNSSGTSTITTGSNAANASNPVANGAASTTPSQPSTALPGIGEDGVDIAAILQNAATQLQNANISAGEAQLRLAIIEAVLTSQTTSPSDDVEEFRPLPWTDGGDPDASFTVSCGFDNVLQAFQALWTPTSDGEPTAAILCAQQAGAVYIMGFIQYYIQTENDAGLYAVQLAVGNSSISVAMTNFATIVPLNSTLQPGDSVWFENPYLDTYMEEKVQPLLDAADQQAANGNKELAKALTNQAAVLANAVQGEEGHNCIYLGQNAAGEAIFSLYGEVQTQAEI